MPVPQAQPAPNGAPAAGQGEASISEQWERAKAAADAKDRAAGVAPEPDEPAGAPGPTDTSAKRVAEAKARAGKYGANDEPEDESEADEPEAKAKEPEGKITPQERAKFREKKRIAWEKIENTKREAERWAADQKAKYGKYERIEAARDAGDDDTVLQELYGYGVNEFQKRAVDRIRGRDPRVERLERELRDEKAAREKAERADTEKREAARIEHDKREWIGGLATELQKHADPVVAKLAQFDEFLGGLKLPGVFDAQEESFDGDDHASAEEAAETVIPKYRAVYEALHSVFGEQDASNPDAPKGVATRSGSASAKPPASKAGKQAIAQRKAAEASPSNGKRVDDATLIARYSQRLAESTEH